MFDISLIIPSYQGRPWIPRALESVAEQTLGRDRFEVIVVVNGEDDGTAEFADAFLGALQGMKYRVLKEPRASLANARNVGIAAAKGRYVTWLDVDDWISPSFLELMAASGNKGVVPLAGIVDVNERTGERTLSSHTAAMDGAEPRPAHARSQWTHLGIAGAKALETSSAQAYPFNVELANGEDVAFFAPYVSRFNLQVDPTPALRGARYFRLVREGSLGRQQPSWEFSVQDRIEVMKHLDAAIADADPDMAAVLRSLMNAQAGFIRKYVEHKPEDYSRAIAALMRSGIGHLPVQSIRPKTNRLLVSYNFAPWNDASGTVAAKRAIQGGSPWNVISKDMSRLRERDHGAALLGNIAASTHIELPGSPAFSSWAEVSSFCKDGLSAIARLEEENGAQTDLYSRSMWPASHFLAALHKLNRKEAVRWTAEFSDPLQRDVEGRARKGAVSENWLSERLLTAALNEGFWLPRDASLFAWAELVPYLFADELLFTNSNQLAYMLSYLDDSGLRARVKQRAVISPQPTLPRDFYSLQRPALVPDPDKTQIGYFGSFYPNRSLDDLILVLNQNAEFLAGKVQLHVFSPTPAQALPERLNSMVMIHPPVGYLEALAQMDTMDVLVVEDASTKTNPAGLNPYLPSKLSDYLGSKARTWAIVEPGSPLSRSGADMVSRLGDPESMLRTLLKITKETKK